MLAKSQLLRGKLSSCLRGWNTYRYAAVVTSCPPTGVQVAPERDLVNFPHPVQLVDPPKTHFVILPVSWFEFFHKKTGVTGGFSFGISLTLFLLSKEWLVIDHELITGVSLVGTLTGLTYFLGKPVTNFVVAQRDADVAELHSLRDDNVVAYADMVKHEKEQQWRSGAQKILVQAKRENVLMQMERTYRERMLEVYNAVRNRLQYHSEISAVEKRTRHKHMAEWVIRKVLESITPEQQKQSINLCIAELSNLVKLQK